MDGSHGLRSSMVLFIAQDAASMTPTGADALGIVLGRDTNSLLLHCLPACPLPHARCRGIRCCADTTIASRSLLG